MAFNSIPSTRGQTSNSRHLMSKFRNFIPQRLPCPTSVISLTT
jgi:hypothetical protein